MPKIFPVGDTLSYIITGDWSFDGSNAASRSIRTGHHIAIKALDNNFLRRKARAVQMALRFTMIIPGVHPTIAANWQERWRKNAELVRAGTLEVARFDAIRTLVEGSSITARFRERATQVTDAVAVSNE